MKAVTKELLVMTFAVIALYLVLVHYTGFSRGVAAIGSSYTGGVKALQGR